MVRERMAKGDCVRCTHCVVCKYRSSNEQLWIKEHCKLAARDERQHGTCKTCKHYAPYRDQFSYGYRGDGYCKITITTSEGNAYINCHDEWYCANYEKAGEKE